MKFWAGIVEPGQRVKVEVDDDEMLHLSQVSLGECKKDKSHVKLFLHVPDQDTLVLSTLIPDKIPQQQLDLIFDEDFEISHNWENGTVFFFGYKTPSPFIGDDSEFDSGSDDSESDEENIELVRPDNEGKPDLKVKEAEKPAEKAKPAPQKVKIVKPSPVIMTDDGDSSDEDDSDDSEDSSDEDEDDSDSEGTDDSDDSDSEEEETPKKKEETPKKKEETPKKVPSGKKRAATSSIEIETPQVKKAKLVTPQKTVDAESKKGSVHVATPYPKAGKTAAANKGQQTPKSAGSHSCKSCNKTFNSETAIASHNKAKHSAGK